MYKIFINNRPLLIVAKSDVAQEKTCSLIMNDPSIDEVMKIIHRAHNEKDPFENVILQVNDPKVMMKELKKSMKYVKAAGGLVKNSEGRTLLIFRNGKWDLPKGKLEEGETQDVAAIREVEEECGISKLSIIRELPSTYHTYIMKDKLHLKRTYWYEMKCDDDRKLVPQREEGITEVIWANESEVNKAKENTFGSVISVIDSQFDNDR